MTGGNGISGRIDGKCTFERVNVCTHQSDIKTKLAYRLSISLDDADIILPLPQKELQLCLSGYPLT